MKKVIQIAAFSVMLCMLLSACGKKKESGSHEKNKTDDKVSTPIADGTPQGEVEDFFKQLYCPTYDEYRAEKERFAANAAWLPWEQFSELGEFYSATWYEHAPHTGVYKYLYTDPDTEIQYIYQLTFDTALSEFVHSLQDYRYETETACCTAKEFYPTASQIASGDFCDTTGMQLTDDCCNRYCTELWFELYYDIDGENKPYLKTVEWIHNGCRISLSKKVFDGDISAEYNDENYVAFDSFDCDIIRSLTNTASYHDAIADLMDP